MTLNAETIDDKFLNHVLEVAQEGARLAGAEIRSVWTNNRSAVKETKKNEVDLVTETDQQCEKLITELLRSKFPSHKIIGEEESSSTKYELTNDPTWTIDPIDGTTNFVHRLPLCCVLLSFIVDKQVLVGVTFDPIAQEMFWAIKGKGAFVQRHGFDVNPRQIHVSKTESIPKAVISMDPGYGRDADHIARFSTLQSTILLKGIRNIRVIGATGLSMAYVASGRLDGGFEEGSWETNCGPKIWDFAPGKLLIEEAGGITRDITKGKLSLANPLDLMQRSFFVAATPALANELIETIPNE